LHWSCRGLAIKGVGENGRNGMFKGAVQEIEAFGEVGDGIIIEGA